MKSFRKGFVAIMVIFTMLFNVGAVSAADKLKDGSYAAEVAWETGSLKMEVEIAKGDVTSVKFYPFISGTIITADMLQYIQADGKAKIEAVLNYSEVYCADMLKAKTGDSVKKASDDTFVYDAFAKLWSDIKTQAGGTTADATVIPTVKNKSVTLYLAGDSKKLTYKIALKNADGYKVTYKSGKSSVASVNAKGKITAKKTGSTNIAVTMTKGSKTYKATVKVTVKAK